MAAYPRQRRCVPGRRVVVRGNRAQHDRGGVTVEAAIAIAAFLMVLAMGLSGLSAVVDQVRCTDAAREAARLTARGTPEEATSAAKRIAPDNARVRITMNEQHIEVRVEATPAFTLLPGIHLHAEAFAVREPDG